MKNWQLNIEKQSFYKFIELKDINIEELIEKGKESPSGRARFCIHKNNNSFFQMMIIYHDQRTIIPVHRHLNSEEDLILINGKLNYIRYEENEEKILLDSSSTSNGMTTKDKIWHNIELISDYIIFIEIVRGPYEKNISEIRYI
jgi:cupin fold WbuC family metalloprotein